MWSIYTFQENIPLFSCYLFSSSNRNGLGRDYAQKLVVNVCINPLTALLGVKNGELITNRFLSNDGASVSGGRIFIRGEKEMVWQMVRNVCEGTSRNTSSMLADVRANRQTEINAIVGYVLEEAKKQQLPVPTLQFLFDAIKGLETRV